MAIIAKANYCCNEIFFTISMIVCFIFIQSYLVPSLSKVISFQVYFVPFLVKITPMFS